jgi:hypothetical protein
MSFHGNAEASTRAPASVSEKSLLYWRYLCRHQPQTEVVRNQVRELSCPSQGWKVRAALDGSGVTEVSEDGNR